MADAFAARVCDFDAAEDLENSSPIQGLHLAPDVPIEGAATALQAAMPELEHWDTAPALYMAGKHVKRLEKRGELAPLSRDQAIAVHIYTQGAQSARTGGWGLGSCAGAESLLYRVLNEALRSRDRSVVKPFFPYLKILLRGLHRLPPVDSTVHRGVALDLSAQYPEDQDVVWWAFSSATASVKVLESPQFCGKTGSRTLFHIKVHRAVDVKRYSAVGGENERLILPATPFTVVRAAVPGLPNPRSPAGAQASVMNAGAGLHIVQLEEDREAPPLISGFAFEGGGGAVGRPRQRVGRGEEGSPAGGSCVRAGPRRRRRGRQAVGERQGQGERRAQAKGRGLGGGVFQ